MARLAALAVGVTGAVALTACGGGGGDSNPPPPPPTYTIGFTVSGLSGSGLALSDNNSDNLSIAANGNGTFAKAIATGGAYSVTVATQPSSPSQTCTVSNATGAVGSANVTNVSIACTTNSYSVQPNVAGLSGSGLVLQNNLADDLTVTQPGAATFATKVQSGGAYSVSVTTQPTNPVQTCTVTNASGTVTSSMVTPTVNCITQRPWILVSVNYFDSSVSLFALDPATGQPRARGQRHVGTFGYFQSPVDINGDGQGRFIYVLNSFGANITALQIDAASGSLYPVANGTVATGTQPATLTGYPGTKALYAVNSGSNDVSAYAIDQTTGALTPLSGSPFKAGTTPNKLALDAAGRFAYVTNDGSSDIYTYSVDSSTGALTEVPNSRVATGSLPFEVLLHRTGKFAYVANTGSPNICAYAVNASTGVLTPLTGSPFATPGVPGDITPFNIGRAPMLLHPNGKFLFVRSSIAKTISVFTIDQTSGALTLAPGGQYGVGDGAVMQTLDPTGRLLFVANRGTTEGLPGSISVFKVDTSSGALTEVTGSPFALSGGPAFLSADPSGQYLYASSSATDLVYTFKIDQTTGALTPLSTGASVVSGDYPLVLLAIPAAAQPGTAATFKSKFAFAPGSDNSLYGFSIDATSGKLTAVPGSPVASMGTGLSAAAVTADGKRVYTVNTGSNYLSPYAIDPTTGKLTLGPSMVGMPSDPVTNALCGPTLLAFDAGNQNAYVNCPGMNSLIAYPVESTTGMFDGGGGTGFAPQPPPSAIAVSDDGRFVFGIRNNTVETHLTWLGTVASAVPNPPSVSAAASALTVHPNGKFVYVANGDAIGNIQTFSVTPVGRTTAGTLTAVGSNTPTGSAPTSIAIDPTGRFLYTANGGDNNISIFSVDVNTGVLAPLAGGPLPTGHHPISVNVDYSGKYLYAVSDTDSSVSTYAIDPVTGALAPVSSVTPIGATPKGLAISRTVEMH